MTFPCFQQDHDPQDAKTYAFRFALNDADSITSATVTVVHPEDGTPVVPTDLTLNDVTPGVIDVAGAVFFRPAGGTLGSIYWLRCVANTALGDVYPMTMGLKVRET